LLPRDAFGTAAGKNQRTLPLQSLVDRDGTAKTALTIIIEEALSAGVEEIGVVICPGDGAAYAAAAGNHAGRFKFIEQAQPLGCGHAVWCARDFTGNAPFLLLVGDHLYTSAQSHGCAKQLVEVASAGDCAVSAVQATHESKLPYYGAVGGCLVPGQPGLHEVSDVLEKPTPTEAEQKLVVPGLRAGHYLCFFGMHVLTPTVMELLGQMVAAHDGRGGMHLSAALARLARRERYLAFEAHGRRYVSVPNTGS
jgi:UTP--glucose-1-phosphate uridylyltransferase